VVSAGTSKLEGSDVSDTLLGWDEVLRFGTVATVVWSAAWFIFTQQIKIKDLIYVKFEELKNLFSDKLDYHERHDDQRFDNITKDIMTLRISQAKSSNRITKYLDENGNDK
jgi:hypothetical protein